MNNHANLCLPACQPIAYTVYSLCITSCCCPPVLAMLTGSNYILVLVATSAFLRFALELVIMHWIVHQMIPPLHCDILQFWF